MDGLLNCGRQAHACIKLPLLRGPMDLNGTPAL
jgi:hypothetical protein